VASEALPLSTCHRFELYVQPLTAVSAEDVLERLARAREFVPRELRPYMTIRRGRGPPNT
jgi:glutamyl-tRNA reductase